MVLGGLRKWIHISSIGVYRASYQSIWSGLFITSASASIFLILISLIGITEIRIIGIDNPYLSFLEGHLLAGLLFLVLIYPSLVILGKITNIAGVNYEQDSIPRDLTFGFVLLISGVVYWFGVSFLFADFLTNLSGNGFSLSLAVIAFFSGVTVTSAGAFIAGGTRVIVACRYVTVEKLIPILISSIKSVLRPLYARYRMLLLIAYLDDRTFYQTLRKVKIEGIDKTINDALEKGSKKE